MRERNFSIDLMSSDAVKRASLEGAAFGKVTIEGTIGSLVHAKFVENLVLELVGTREVLRIDLATEDLAKEPLQTKKVKGSE